MNRDSERKSATEAGFPSEWRVEPISSLATVVRGASPRPAGDQRFFDGDYIAWLTVSAITNVPEHQLEVGATAGCLTKEGARFSRTLYPETVIIANSGATLGVAKVLGLTCCANDGVAALLGLREDVQNRFLCYYLNSQTKYLREIVATGNGQPNLNTNLIGGLHVPVPPIAEQQRISALLANLDHLLATLENLVTKKRALKQAVMQDLLTGKRRLPGFSGIWETRRFGELFQILSTAHNSRADLSTSGDTAYLHYGDIHASTTSFLDCGTTRLPTIDGERVARIALLRDGDLVMADVSEDEAGIGRSVEIRGVGKKRVVGGLHTFLLRGDEARIALGYRGYLQFIPSVRGALQRLATGISVLGISKNNVRSIEVILPPVEEQTAITAVLSDMDAEIETLEARLEKTRFLKQGMMQELLTGRIRLT